MTKNPTPLQQMAEDFIILWPNGLMCESLFVTKLRDQGYYSNQIAKILMAIDEVCHDCWNGKITCQCRYEK